MKNAAFLPSIFETIEGLICTSPWNMDTAQNIVYFLRVKYGFL